MEIPAFFNFLKSDNRPLKEKISVTQMVRNSTTLANSTKGETEPYSPIVAAILILSSPVNIILIRKKTANNPIIALIILIMFCIFMNLKFYFFWATRISIRVIDASSISLTILSILAII